jgi:hypothetical protein
MTQSIVDAGSRKRTWFLLGTGLVGGLFMALIVLVRSASWAGPALANGLRSVLGDRPVTRLEELVAATEDRWLRWTQHGVRPRSLREASPAAEPLPALTAQPLPLPRAPAASLVPEAPPPVVDAGIVAAGKDAGRAALPSARHQRFVPEPVPPPFPEVAAEGDGNWEPVPDPERPGEEALLYRTLLHPDPERTYAELFVVVMPLADIDLRVVPGTEEPASDNPEVERLAGRGLIAPADEPLLLGAFNGGFMARHGHHGMWVDGVAIVPLQPGLCTIQRDPAGQIGIASWRAVDQTESGAWYRQTPPCMVERGQLHPGLANPETRKWGATLEGETVIRRSAIALSRAGDQLFVAVSNATTAPALALGMQRAGGWTVAQLDVNWSFPRFLMFPRNHAGEREAAPLFHGFLFERDEMLRRPAPRDFFYVVRRSPG